MQQGQFDDAEAAFKKATKLDPKLQNAQFNLAQIPFKKKEYAKARDRFETLYKRIPGGDKNQAAALLKFKIYMTLLMEGKESRAHSMMEEFQFTGDTPALYYAQAGWEYKHNNAQKAEEWTNSANKIYSPALNGVFADAFYDVGWLQRPEGTTAPAVAFDTGNVATSQTDSGPAVEPSPIPDKGLTANKQGGNLALAPSAPDGGMELASAGTAANQTSLTASAPETNSPAEQSVAQSPSTSVGSTTASQPVAPDTASTSTVASNQNQAEQQPAAQTSPPEQTSAGAIASQPDTASASTVASKQNQTEQQPAAQTSPPEQASAGIAPAKASSSTVAGASSRRLWIVGGLLLGAVVLLALAILPILRRGYKFTVPGSERPEPSADTAVFKARTAPVHTVGVQGNGFDGGPRQVSLELKAWNSPLRPSALPLSKDSGAFNRLKGLKSKPSRLPDPVEPQHEEAAPVTEPFFETVGPVLTAVEPQQPKKSAPVAEPFLETVGPVLPPVEPRREKSTPVAQPFFESVGPVIEQAPEVVSAVAPQEPGLDGFEPVTEFTEASTSTPRSVENEILELPEEPVFAAQEADEFSEHPREEAVVAYEQPSDVFGSGAEYAWPGTEAAAELTAEPIENDQPHETIFAEHEALVERENFPERESFTEVEASVNDVIAESASDFQPPPVVPLRPVFPQPTIPATMPETTQTPPALIAKAPAPPVPQPQPQAPVPAAGMQTSVQLTFSFEIAAMQLTPSFKMGVLKVRPISKLVTMRLPSPQRAQSPLNLQVAFEVVKIQPVAGSLGTIRVVPSQQQRPAMGGMPSFAVAGLQVVPNSETAPVQLTPSAQGRASVFVTVPFQISTLEFSPTLEIGSVTLNSNSKQVVVQLPGTGPGPVEGAPMFEIANLELNEGGEIVMMQLNLLGGPKRA